MSNYPDNYQRNNTARTKFLNVVVQVEDSPYIFSIVTTYKKIRYGDPIEYGEGYVYGGLIAVANNKPYLSTNSNLRLSQKIEPEQGKGSASTMTLEFVDVNGFMTNFSTAGQVLNEPLGNKQVKVWVGYDNSSFPEDYFVVYRGYISGIKCQATKVIWELVDANYKTKQQSCYLGKTAIRSLAYNFNPSDVDAGTDTITITGHEYVQGYLVQFTSTGALPSPLVAGTNYYIIGPTANTFQLSATLNGATLNILDQGTGTHSVSMTSVGPYATTIPVIGTEGFSLPIIGPNGSYDPALGTYLQVEAESMKYSLPSQVFQNKITVVRGSRGTTATGHAPTMNADNWIEITGNIVDNSLKLMLSGWNGPWISGVDIKAFGDTEDPGLGVLPQAIVLPDGKDAIEDYGLAPGDYLTVTGSTYNDGTYTVSSFSSANDYLNNVIIINEFITVENPTTGVMAIRSQYDTFPVNCGTMLRPIDVDVIRWQRTKQQFAFQADCTFRNLIKDPIAPKDFIEAEYAKPGGLYVITRFGRIAVSATKPPLAGEILVILDKDTVINPQNITVSRSMTTRRFFDNVQYFYDTNDAGNQTSVTSLIDSNAITEIGNSALPINANGLRTDLGASTFINRRGGYILRRYQRAAVEISLETNWQAGSLIQVSDTVAVYDNGGLQISNLSDGTRDLGSQLYEVISWDLDIKSGVAKLTILQQLGYQVNDRFCGIAPSSIVTTGGTTTRIPLLISYGGRYPGQEWKKYEPILGDRIQVHSADYTFVEEVSLVGFDPVSPNTLLVDPPLSIPAAAGMIVDCAQYPNNTDATEQAKTKLLFTFIDPTLTVVTGISTTQFTISAGDAALVPSNSVMEIHNDDYSRQSTRVAIASIVGTLVTLSAAIEFVPQPGDLIEIVGFLDGGGGFLIL